MRARHSLQGLRGLALSLSLVGLTAQAQPQSVNATSSAESLDPVPVQTTQAIRARGGRSIVIANPMIDEETSSKGSDLKTYLMPDDLIDQITNRWDFELQEFAFRQSYNEHSRDSRLSRALSGSPQQEARVRGTMADFMKRYMIRKGLPQYLSTKKSTRFIGEQYIKAEAAVQKAGRVEFKGKDDSWKFATGVNPFTTKVWLKYSSPHSSLELYNIFEKKNSLGVAFFTQQGRYIPNAGYLIQENALVAGTKFRYSRVIEYELKSSWPLYRGDPLNNTVTTISSTYRF